MPLQPGDRFGRYEITELLGKGGMGEVYRAQDTILHRRVALKVLHPPAPGTGGGSGPNQTDGAARILREARAAAGIEHPNAISIYDVGEVDGVPFLAMEFVPGRTLRTFMGDESVTLARRIRWLVDVARALGAAHALGLVHRDIKPENIMVRDDGTVKVLDFGIARRTATKLDANAATEAAAVGTLTADGVVVGTPLYMAPEQMRGDSLDGRADQFAWGVVAYELLTGKLPWDRSADGLQLVAQILSREVEAPRVVNPEIPASVDGAIRMALSKSPSYRFRQMEEAAVALEPHAAPAGVMTGRSEVRRSIPAEEISLAPTEAIPSGEGPPNVPSTKTQLATPGPTASLGPAKRGWRGVVGVAVGVVVVGGVVAWLGPRRATQAVQQVQDAGPVGRAESEMSANAEATAAYKAGVQMLRDGSLGPASARLDRAIELDPTFAAARLRRAVLPFEQILDTTPQDLQIARSGRASLGEHDRVVLDAVEPWTRVPPDLVESARRFEVALKREPTDADFTLLLGWTLNNAGQHARADAILDQAVASDPSLPMAHWLRARERLALGDVAAAMVSYGRCLELSPGATSCIDDLATLQAHEGKCEEMVLTVRRQIAVAPDQPGPYGSLAAALFAVGDSIDAVRTALAQKWERLPTSDRRLLQDLDEASLAVLTGRFEQADRLDREVESLMVAIPREVVHFLPAYDRMLIDLETGRNADALRLANDYLARRSGWQRDELTQEPTIGVYAVQREAGGLTDAKFVALRDDWLARDRKRALGTGLDAPEWSLAFALPARTPAEGAAAMAARPDVHPLTPYLSQTVAEENEPVGRVSLLAGNLDEAVTYLRRASRSCAVFAPWAPQFSTWASAELGEALEARGDTEGACAAYRRVLTRWGASKPSSRTAARARGRVTALRCPP